MAASYCGKRAAWNILVRNVPGRNVHGQNVLHSLYRLACLRGCLGKLLKRRCKQETKNEYYKKRFWSKPFWSCIDWSQLILSFLGSIELPPTWSPMGSDEHVKLEVVPPTSVEYSTVKSSLMLTAQQTITTVHQVSPLSRYCTFTLWPDCNKGLQRCRHRQKKKHDKKAGTHASTRWNAH